MRAKRVGSALVLTLVLALGPAVACSSSTQVVSRTTASPEAPTGGFLGTLGQPGCTPPAQLQASETGIDSRRGSLWALFFSPVPPPAGAEIKVVWRMTGTGTFAFRVTDSAGTLVPLAWGPEVHAGSSWTHPGDEVGTGFNFPHAGCWDIHVARADAYGDLWLQVL